MEPLKFSPSGLTYINCKRCFYLSYNYGINYSSGFPGVFSTFDITHKNRFQDLSTKEMFSNLPDGKFYKTVNSVEAKSRKKNNESQFKEMELPSFIRSDTLKDNKSREFFLAGKPDLVVKFDDGTYGILDFKTTSEDDKTQAYKHQLEAYAQIFEKPGATGVAKTPRLFPISYMGLMQFTPKEIFEHNDMNYKQNFNINHYKLKRNTEEFYVHVTSLIDIILEEKIPTFNNRCSICVDTQKNLKVMELDFI
jgi:hypothetical protein|tara:strand:+ start:234 stop:986 length:753 start_codon:yes stop_codon:yes gene_type:complete